MTTINAATTHVLLAVARGLAMPGEDHIPGALPDNGVERADTLARLATVASYYANLALAGTTRADTGRLDWAGKLALLLDSARTAASLMADCDLAARASQAPAARADDSVESLAHAVITWRINSSSEGTRPSLLARIRDLAAEAAAQLHRNIDTGPSFKADASAWRERADSVNRAALLRPVVGTGDDELPCIEIGGVQVYAYLRCDTGAFQVSVDLDRVEPWLCQGPHDTVPLNIAVGHHTVYSSVPTETA